MITMLGACHLILGVEEKPFVVPAGTGGNAASSSGQGAASSSSQSVSNSSTASGMGGMGGMATTASSSISASSTGAAGGTGGQSASSSTTGAGGSGGSPPSTDTCGTCTGNDVSNNLCALQGNIETGIGWTYFDPKCLQNTNSSIHCLGMAQQGCRRCRLCSPGTKDNINKAGGCFVCLDSSGTNCATQAGTPTGTNQGEEYCPPCICQKYQSAIHSYIINNVDNTVQFAEVLDMCQGNYDHCKP